MIKTVTLYVLFLITSTQIQGYDYPSFDSLQGTVSYETIRSRIENHLKKDEELNDYYELTESELILYASKKEKNKGIAEYRFKIGVDKKSPNKSSSLQGKKIAIDPGHIGGPFAYLEKRYVDMKGSSIQFDEGTLAYQTALLLKDLLEKAGAAVLITKESMHQGVYAKDFWQWLQEEFPNTIERHLSSISNTKARKAEKEKWLHNSSLSTIFRRWYNTLDLCARAKKINNFAPDITLIIHYNCGGRYDEVTGESIGTTHNNILMFIPGAFMKKEISKKENRLDFLRLSITDQLDESLLLAKEIARCTSERLQVSLAGKESLKSSSIYASEGVFCRNLALTRLIHSPVCYGETLFQDNFEESKRLSREELFVGGILASKRIEDVAKGYFDGIKYYLSK